MGSCSAADTLSRVSGMHTGMKDPESTGGQITDASCQVSVLTSHARAETGQTPQEAQAWLADPSRTQLKYEGVNSQTKVIPACL